MFILGGFALGAPCASGRTRARRHAVSNDDKAHVVHVREHSRKRASGSTHPGIRHVFPACELVEFLNVPRTRQRGRGRSACFNRLTHFCCAAKSFLIMYRL
eukprot:TRINITY_DN18039_c0_g1_i1.p2 TRINITY_DN18039_c0_g1~~TRINITY_DN18039_c0_g1_i1.p2  ORF type:complete len:101 (+),score=0.43 TRINITY_DN18039_c0_g1_i1:57-359(+)